jgi:hypothetical protein
MKRKNRGMNIEGAPQEEIPFSIDVKGGVIETLMRSDDHRGSMSMSVAMFKCFHNVGVSINAKGGDCWTFDLDNWLSLISTLGE